MNCDCTIETDAPAAHTSNEVRLPMGLLGFERIKEYLLLANPVEEPFAWLQVKDNSSLAFVVINPFLVMPDYHPDIPEPDVTFLDLKGEDDAQLFNIVTIHPSGSATVNLKGPVVINRHTRVGKQVVIANATAYSVQHPLPVAEAAA